MGPSSSQDQPRLVAPDSQHLDVHFPVGRGVDATAAVRALSVEQPGPWKRSAHGVGVGHGGLGIIDLYNGLVNKPLNHD